MADSREMWDAGGIKEPDDEQNLQEVKFTQMQEYVPFLETMIAKLERTHDNSREAQLTKLKSLHGVLTNSKKKLKIETLIKCEEVLKKLREKVDKVPGISGELSKLAITRDKSEAVVSSTTSQASAYVMPLKKAVARVKDDSPSRMSPVSTVSSSQSDNCVSSTETRLPEDILAQSREKLTKIVDISSDNSSDMEWIYDRRKDVLSGKEKALKNSSVAKFLSYDIASTMDWGSDSNRQPVNKATPLSESLSISYNIAKFSDRATKSFPEQQHQKQLWASHSDNRLSKPLDPNEVVVDQDKNLASNTTSSNAFTGHLVSSEDDTTPVKKEDGLSSRSLRAKLEEEIHKVHRVGVSTGGALRGLINKDDRKNSPVKSKTDKSNIDSLSPVRSFLDKVEKSSSRLKLPDQITDEKIPLFPRSPTRIEKWKGSSDPRKQPTNEQSALTNSDSEALKLADHKAGEISDPRLKQGSSYSVRNLQNSHQQGHSDSQGKAQGLLSTLTSEDLQRIVTENLRSLPSPPPNTKEILENVKAASPLNASWDKSKGNTQTPYSSNFRSPNISFNQKQSQGSGNYGYENIAEQQPSSSNRTVLLPTPAVPPQYVGTHQNIMYGSARHRGSETHKTTQYGNQGNMIDPRLNVHRSAAVDHRGSKDPRLNNAEYTQTSPGEQWPGSPCYGILSHSVSEVSAGDYKREPTSINHPGRHIDQRTRERCPTTGEPFSPRASSGQMWGTQHQHYAGRSDTPFMQQHGPQPQVGPQATPTNKNISSPFYTSRPYRVPTELTPSLLGPGPRPPGYPSHAVVPVRRGPVLSERDPRRRSIEEIDGTRNSRSTERKPRSTERRPRSTERRPRTADSRHSRSSDRRRDERRKEILSKSDRDSHRSKDSAKDIISPLNSLYEDSSVPKTGKGYGFQNFKIPKIRRDIPTVSRSRSPGPVPKIEEERRHFKNKSDEAMDEKISKQISAEPKDNTERKETEKLIKTENNTEVCTKKPEELTQELIENFIRKSFESGEGKKLLDNAIFLENLNEKLKAKKLKKIKRILESDSDESDSDSSEKSKREAKDKLSQKKSSPVVKDKKKTRRRVLISSDSSSDNSGDDKKLVKQEKCNREEDDTEDEKPLSELSSVKSNIKEEKEPDLIDVSPKTKSKVKKNVTVDVKAENKRTVKQKSEEHRNSESECDSHVKNIDKKDKGDLKLAKKHKRRSPLELLQEDIREMFISEGVVTATGYRMCRLLKEVKPGMSIEEVSKTEARRMQEEAEIECEKLSKTNGRQRGRRKIIREFSDENDEEEDDDEQEEYGSNQKYPKRKPGRRKQSEHQKCQHEQYKNEPRMVFQKSTSSKGGVRDKRSVMHEDDLLSEFTGSKRDLRRLARKGWSFHEKQIPCKYEEHRDDDDDDDEDEEEEEEATAVSDKDSILSEKSITHQKSWEYVETQEPFLFTRRHLKKRTKFDGSKIERVIKKLAEKNCIDTSQGQGISLDVIKELAEKSSKKTTQKQVVSINVITELSEKYSKEIPQEQDISIGVIEELTRKPTKEKLQEQDIPMDAITELAEKSVKETPHVQDLSAIVIKELTEQSSEKKLQEQEISVDTIKELTEKSSKEITQEQDAASASTGNRKTDAACDTCEKDKTGKSTEVQIIELPVSKKPVTPKKGKKKKASAWQMGIIKKKHVHKSKFDRPDLAKNPISSSIGDSEEQTELGNSEKRETNSTKLKHAEGQPETEVAQENLPCAEPKEIRPNTTEIMDDKFLNSRNESANKECSSNDVSIQKKRDTLESFQGQQQEKHNTVVEKTYAFDGSLKYRCKLCSYFGKSITNHYKTQHPKNEVYISRLNLTEADAAIRSAQNYDSESSSTQNCTDKSKKQSLFKCRMCDLTTKGITTFYEHLTTHTGEYRYKCDVCQYISSSRQNFKTHFLTHHPGFDIKTLILHSPNLNDPIVRGYLCTACHFVQIEKMKVEKHVTVHSDSDFNNSELPKVLSINMSKEDALRTNDTHSNSTSLSSSKCKDDSSNPNSETPESGQSVELHKPSTEPVKESVHDKPDDVAHKLLQKVVKENVENVPNVIDERSTETTINISEVVSDKIQNIVLEKEESDHFVSVLPNREVTATTLESSLVITECNISIVENDETSELVSSFPYSGNSKEANTDIDETEAVRTTPSEDLVAMSETVISVSEVQNDEKTSSTIYETVAGKQMARPKSPLVVQEEIDTVSQFQQDCEPEQSIVNPAESEIEESEESRKLRLSAFLPSDTADTHEEKLQNERFKTMEAITQSLKIKSVIKSSIDSLIESIDIRKKQESSSVDAECTLDNSDINKIVDITKNSGKSDESTIIDERRALEAAQAVKCSDTMSTEPAIIVSSTKSKDDPYSEQENIDDDVIKCSDSSLFDKIFSPALNKIQKKEYKLKQPVVKPGVIISTSASSYSGGSTVEIEPLTKDKIRNLSECSFEDDHDSSLPLIVQKLAKYISDPSGILSDEEPCETENNDAVAQKDSTADSSDADSVNYDELRDEVATYEKRIMALSGCHTSDLTQTVNKEFTNTKGTSAKDKLDSEVLSYGSEISSKTGPPPVAIKVGKKIISEITFGTQPDIRVGNIKARLYGSKKVLFSCFMQNCRFQCTHVENFSQHLKIKHNDSYWDGICQTCNKNFKGDGAKRTHLSHAVAFSHLLDEHVWTDSNFVSDSCGKMNSLIPQQEETEESSSLASINTKDLNSSVLSGNLKTDKQLILQKSDSVIADHSYNKHRESDDTLKEISGAIKCLKESGKDNSVHSGPVDIVAKAKPDNGIEKPKIYLRTRRLSGDKLSGHKDEAAIQSSVSDVDSVTAGEADSSSSDGVSFLKIGTVVSLNPNAENSVGAIEELDVIPNEILADEKNCEAVAHGFIDASPQTPEVTTLKADSETSSLPSNGDKRGNEAQLVNAVIVSPVIPVSSGQTPVLQVIPAMRLCSVNNNTVTAQPAHNSAIQMQQTHVWSSTAVTTATTTSIAPSRLVRLVPQRTTAIIQSSLSPTRKILLPKPRVELPKPRVEIPKPGIELPNQSSQEEESSESGNTSDDVSSSNEWLPQNKNIKTLRRMMTAPKLRNLYKCMDKNCSYTEDNGRNFIIHLGSSHFNQRHSEWNRCPYCPFKGNGRPSDLVRHITKTHGHCQYQCAYCFFRGMVCSFVVLHQNTGHINKPVKVLLCTDLKANPPQENDLEPLTSVVLPYVCDQGNCDTKFYNPSDFLLHLQWQHHQVTTLTCHICKAPSFKATHLISHYKFHSLSLYQCRHCLHGTDSEEEIQQHLCNFHHNLQALAVLRHFDPAKGNIHADILRLKIVNLDQTVSEDVIIQPSDTTHAATEIETSHILEEWPEEGVSEIQESAETIHSEVRESEVSDVQMASFEIVSSEIVGHVIDNVVSETAENVSFRIVTNEGTESVCETVLNKITDEAEVSQNELTGNIKSKNDSRMAVTVHARESKREMCAEEGESPRSLLEKNDGNEDDDADDDDDDDDVQVVYQLTTKHKLCNHIVCKGSCKFRKLSGGKESAKLKIRKSDESLKETDSQNLSAVPDLLTKSGQVILKEKDKATAEQKVHDVLHSSLRAGKSGAANPTSPAKVGFNLDSESEFNSNSLNSFCLESGFKFQEDKEQTSSSLDGSTVAEDSFTLVEQRKHYMKTGLTGEDLYLCGNARCEFRAATGSQLREHLFVCDLSREGILKCPHCARPVKAANSLVDHLRIHGIPRYSCALCKYRATAPTTVAKHLKQQHRVSYTETVPVDRFLNNPETDMFVVCPKVKGKHKRGQRGQYIKSVYRPEEIHLLPMSAILKDPIECSVCAFKTKVRSNMKRHLGLHLDPAVDPADIPTVEVVNPVPCLERNEKMFDKMTNLAASSNIASLKQGTPPITSATSTATTGTLNDDVVLQQYHHQQLVPHYVEEHRRYVCSAEGCNYLTCSEAMLRHHLRALHPDDAVYRCPHCPPSASEVSLDRVGAHLRMHGGRLYGCAHCPYHHFQRHIVERHLGDRHPEKRAFVVVIRESEAAQTQTTADLPSTVPSETLLSPTHLWVCGLCDLPCQSRNEVIDHASSAHGTKSQFKCSLCAFRTSSKLSFEPHFASRHPGEGAYMVDVYRRIEAGAVSANSVVTPTETNFDTRPLWSRNSAGVRHIRGILIAEEEQIDDDVIEISNTIRKLSSPIKKENTENISQRLSASGGVQVKRETEGETDTKKLEEQKNDTVGTYGPYGKPAAGNLFVCTLCERYKTKFKADMRDHLYRELNYSKWVCTHCRLMSCSRRHLQKHSAKMHDKDRKPEAIAALPPDKEIEDWVDKVLVTQTSLMKQGEETVTDQPQKKPATGIKRSHSETMLQEKVAATAPSSGSSAQEDQQVASQPTKRAAALLARALSQTSMLELGEPLSSGSLVTSPVDSDAEEPALEKKQNSASSSENKKKLTSKEPKLSCMDCGAKCINTRGLKLHIRVNHMCTARWLCGYCRFGGSSEQVIRQHCQLRHRAMPESVISNEEGAAVKLDDEFWETNYGLPPKNINATCSSPSPSLASSDQQSEISFDDADMQAELTELVTAEEARRCSHCTYTCRSPSDLRKHEMRHWVQKPFKCGHCNFEAIREYEVRKHSEKVHPQQPVSVKQKEVPLQPDIKPLRIKRHMTGIAALNSNTEQEAEDNEEQPPPPVLSSGGAGEHKLYETSSDGVLSDTPPVTKRTKIFRCFYCPRRATSLAVIHEHWQKTHKSRVVCANGVPRLGLPFSYKEMAVDDIPKGKKQLHSNRSNFMCVHCKRKGSQSSLLKHHEEVHPDKEFSIVETTAHRYECSHCHFAALALHILRKHFEYEHPKSEFRYIVKASKLIPDESEHVIVRTESTAMKRIGPSGMLCEAGNYICLLCGEKFDSEDQFHSDHHNVHHANIEPKYSFEANSHDSKRTKYECPRCCFISDTYDILKEHLERHIKAFKCGYCSQQYDLESKVVRHCQLSHGDCEIRVVHVRDTEMENLKKLVVQRNVSDMDILSSPLQSDSKLINVNQKICQNVARKSTGLSSLTAKLYKSSSATSSREESVENSEDSSAWMEKPYSFYGRSPSPVDKNTVLAFANYGGSAIRMSLSTFSKLYNIYPKVRLRDLKNEKLPTI